MHEFTAYPVQAFVTQDPSPLIVAGSGTTGPVTGETYFAHTSDTQGPLADVFAWGTGIEDAAHRLAELVWEVARDGALTGFDDKPVRPQQIGAIHVRAMTTTVHPVTSTVDPELPPLAVPYEVLREDGTYYATTQWDIPSPLGNLVLPASSERDAVNQLARWIRTHIVLGHLEPALPSSWRGSIALERVHHHLYSSASFTTAA